MNDPEGEANPELQRGGRELEAEITKLQRQVFRLENELWQQSIFLSSVLASRSWRLTSPLRALGEYRRKLRPLALLGRRESIKQGHRRIAFGQPVDAHPKVLGTIDAFGPGNKPHPQESLLVVVHVSNSKELDFLRLQLAEIDDHFHLIVTIKQSAASQLSSAILAAWPNAEILEVRSSLGQFASALDGLTTTPVFKYSAILLLNLDEKTNQAGKAIFPPSQLPMLRPLFSKANLMVQALDQVRNIGAICAPEKVHSESSDTEVEDFVEFFLDRLGISLTLGKLSDYTYPAGGIFMCRPWVIQRLLDLRLPEVKWPANSKSKAFDLELIDEALVRLTGILISEGGMKMVTANQVDPNETRCEISPNNEVQVLAIMLPQFHRVKENDEWWGEGYTEWMAVESARPQYNEHRIIKPVEGEQYDLSTPEGLEKQAHLARKYGVDGFIVYHYWFEGRRLLEKPIDVLLKNPQIDLPFALCWANHNWTRSWDGLDSHVLVNQNYPAGWAESFALDLVPYMSDSRYLRVGNRPMLFIFNPPAIPDLAEAMATIRSTILRELTFDVHLVGVHSGTEDDEFLENHVRIFDAMIVFPPAGQSRISNLTPEVAGRNKDFRGRINSYLDVMLNGSIPIKYQQLMNSRDVPIHEAVMSGWDNTPRKGNSSVIFHGSHPVHFRAWLARSVEIEARRNSHPMVVINAWNEWGEGSVIEPSATFGHGFLESVSDIRKR